MITVSMATRLLIPILLLVLSLIEFIFGIKLLWDNIYSHIPHCCGCLQPNYTLIRVSSAASGSLLKFRLYDFNDYDNDWAQI